MSPRRREVLSAGVAGLTLAVAGCLDDDPPVDPSIGDVTTYRYDRQRTNHASGFEGPTGDVTEAWSREIKASFSTPVIKDGILYVAATDAVHALNAVSGDERWRTELPEWASNHLVIDDEMLFVVTNSGHVMALDIADGERNWGVHLDQRFEFMTSTVANGNLIVGTSGGAVFAIDVRDGSKTWTAETDEGIGFAGALDGNELFITESDGTLAVIDATSGERTRSREVGGDFSQGTVLAPPDLVLARHVDDQDQSECDESEPDEYNGVLALDRQTLQREWRFEVVGGMWHPPAVANGAAYQGVTKTQSGIEQYLYATDLNTGEELWRAVEGRRGFGFGPPTVTDQAVYVGTSDGFVAALDPRDGSERWRFENDDPVLTSPVVTDGYLFVCTDAQSLIALTEG